VKARLGKFISSTYLRYGVILAIISLSLYLAMQGVSFKDIKKSFTAADSRFIWLALVSVALNTLCKAVRWKYLIGPAGQKIHLTKILSVLLTGQMLNTLYPIRIGDFSRVYVMGGMGPGRVFTMGTVIIEKLFDTITYFFLFLCLFLLIPFPGWLNSSIYGLIVLTLGLSLLVFIVARQRTWLAGLVKYAMHWFPVQVRPQIMGYVDSGLSSLNIFNNQRVLLILAFWSAFVWGTAILNNYLVLLAFNIHLPLTAPLLLLIGLQAGISVSTVPGTIGLFEYICVLALSVFQIDRTFAFSFGILLHSIVFIPSTLLGILSFWLLGLSGSQGRLLREAGENR
jgi:uncharacterized protein (TIRG00374 family)